MKLIKTIEDVKSSSITINLPADFNAKKVEITIKPIDQTEDSKPLLKDLLLEAPTLTDEEAQEYKDVRNWMNKWSVEEF